VCTSATAGTPLWHQLWAKDPYEPTHSRRRDAHAPFLYCGSLARCKLLLCPTAWEVLGLAQAGLVMPWIDVQQWPTRVKTPHPAPGLLFPPFTNVFFLL